MANKVIYTRYFLNRAKDFKKRHPSLDSDLEVLETSLVKNPRQGNDLGGGLHKVRLAVKVKVEEKVRVSGYNLFDH